MKIKFGDQVLVINGEGRDVDLSWASPSGGWDVNYNNCPVRFQDGNRIEKTSIKLYGSKVNTFVFVIDNQRFVDENNTKNFGPEIIPLAVQVESCISKEGDKFEYIDL